MRDDDLVDFLRWALPRLGLRWEGFRKPRGQVKKRLARRLEDLGLPDLGAYRRRLEEDPVGRGETLGEPPTTSAPPRRGVPST